MEYCCSDSTALRSILQHKRDNIIIHNKSLAATAKPTKTLIKYTGSLRTTLKTHHARTAPSKKTTKTHTWYMVFKLHTRPNTYNEACEHRTLQQQKRVHIPPDIERQDKQQHRQQDTRITYVCTQDDTTHCYKYSVHYSIVKSKHFGGKPHH